MFESLHQNTIPAIQKKQPSQDILNNDETEDEFVTHYGHNKQSKARRLYKNHAVFDLSYQLLYRLPVEEKKYRESDESTKHDPYFHTFNKLYDNIAHVAKYVEKKSSWLFGDSVTYDIGKRFLADVAVTIETHFTTITQPKASNVSKNSFTKYVQLKLLKDSPEAFVQSQKNEALLKHTDAITAMRRNLWVASKTPSKIDITAFDKMSTEAKNLQKKIQDQVISKEIEALENSWTRTLFGWLTGDNKKLADLKQLQSAASIIQEHTSQLLQEIAAQREIELAKHCFLTLQEKLCEHPDEMTADNLKAWQDNIAILNKNKKLVSSLIEPAMEQLENQLKNNVFALLTTAEDQPSQTIERILQVQFKALLSNHHIANGKKILENYINALLASIKDPYHGCRFIKQLLPCISADDYPSIASLLTTKLEQFDAWSTLKSFTAAKNNDVPFDADRAYLALVTLVSKPMTPGMAHDVSEFMSHFVADITNEMTALLKANLHKQSNDTKQRIAVLKQKLTLISLDKLNPLQTKQMSILHDARSELVKLIKEHIQTINQAIDLHDVSLMLEDVWPNGIFPKYVRVKNNSNESFTWTSSQKIDVLPSHIACNREEIKLYKPLINDITIQAQEESSIYFVPSTEDLELKNAIKEKRSEFLNTHIESDDLKKLAFLKENECGIIYKYWKDWFIGNDTPLTNKTLFAYGDALVSDKLQKIYEKVQDLTCGGHPVESAWLSFELSDAVEMITDAFDKKLEALLNKDSLKKTAASLNTTIDPIDIGHLLLQWRFINLFHDPASFYQHKDVIAGNNILKKMRVLIQDNPNFIHHFLGSMSKTQLEVLESTCYHDTIYSEWNDEPSKNNKTMNQTTLFHQMSALIQQELLAYLNGDPVNMNLFNDHINFVLKQLDEQAFLIKCLEKNELAKELKSELQQGMDWLKSQTIPGELAELIAQQQLKLTNSKSIIEYIKQFPQEIIQHLPAEFASFIKKTQYQYADFKKSFQALLSEHNITQPADYEKLRGLKHTALYTLVDMVIQDKKDICRIFSTKEYYPITIPKTNWGLLPTLSACYKAPVQCASYLYQGASSALHALSYLNPVRTKSGSKTVEPSAHNVTTASLRKS